MTGETNYTVTPTSMYTYSTNVYPEYMYSQPVYAPSKCITSIYPTPYAQSAYVPPPTGGSSHKHSSSKDKWKTVSSSPSPSPHIYNPPPPSSFQSPSIQFPLPIYAQHANASSTYAPFAYSQPTYAPQTFPPPIYTPFAYSQPPYAPLTYPPPIYPLSGELSHKLPQLCAMPNPGSQGHPKPSQPEPFQANENGIRDVKHLNEPDVKLDSKEAEVFDDERHNIKPSTKGFLPAKSTMKSKSSIIQSQNEKPWTKYGDLKEADRSIFFKAFSNCVWHPRYNDLIESDFNSRASHSLSNMLKEARLKGQCPHWIDNTIWQRLLEHWNPAGFQLTSVKEKKHIALEKDGCLQTRGSIGTAQQAAREEVPSSASSGRELASNMVEVLLQRMVISSEETNRKLNEMMKLQQESRRIIEERQEKQEELIRKLDQEREGRH
ncbi:uncharacterized protein LOC131620453 [Vicia villosa]|uniref:uncharacterized protein LOC131620453 n=1 Tax=Vicia villosa TaxID=3911 RepID=UPI00273AEED6|nr:uncharacterized protein LOC131620453 [Vicia villosa]